MASVEDFRKAAEAYIAVRSHVMDEWEQPVGGIRLMGDFGAVIPLWDEEGLLTDNPNYARRLGLSEPTLEDLVAWGMAFESCVGAEGYVDFGRALSAKLQSEIGSRSIISFVP